MTEKTTVKCLVTGKLQVNTFILTRNSHAVIIDPGGDPELIVSAVKTFKNIAVLLTHSHYDHIGAINEVLETLPQARLFAHKNCIKLASNSSTNICRFLLNTDYALTHPAAGILRDKINFTFGGINITPLHSTGHSAGHLCYYLPTENIVFCGDLLTAEDIGRHDVPGSNLDKMIDDCLEMIANIRSDTIIHPGHGNTITAEEALNTNPHLKLRNSLRA